VKWRLNDNHQDALVPRDACDLYEICGIVRPARAVFDPVRAVRVSAVAVERMRSESITGRREK